ncbi:MAG: 4Fe-4S binding protein [Clostridia bacterium]|nr:4Fe-4S binding protein [Clostridia bacterium]
MNPGKEGGPVKGTSMIFSPTGGTRRVATVFAEALFGEAPAQSIDLTERALNLSLRRFGPEDVCVVAVPVYGGRIPAPAAARLGRMSGGRAKAVPIVVYGNRDYEDALLELYDILSDRGFDCVAALAAIAEHSILHQYARARPDADDRRTLRRFAETVRPRLATAHAPLVLPGSHPYRDAESVPLKPKAGRGCTGCTLCAHRCPVGAIPTADPTITDKSSCISCMRCVSLCPVGARTVSPVLLSAAGYLLKKACAEPKKNQLFLSRELP